MIILGRTVVSHATILIIGITRILGCPDGLLRHRFAIAICMLVATLFTVYYEYNIFTLSNYW